MKYINFSEQESEYTNLRIGRTQILYDFNIEQFIKEIIELELDICRLKVDISNPNMFSLLEKIKLPKSNHSFIIEQSIDLKKLDKELEINIEFRNYTEQQKEELLEIISKIQKSDTFNIYYKDELIEKLLPNDLLKEVIAQYQTTFDYSIHPNKNCYLAYQNNKLIGFCTLDVQNNIGDGVLVGILPEYRSLDLFKNFVRKQINESKKLGYEKYTCKIVAFNSRSLNTTLKQGMQISRIILNINIIALLNYKRKIIEVSVKDSKYLASLEEVLNQFFKNTIMIEEFNFTYEYKNEDLMQLLIIEDFNIGIIRINQNLGYIKYKIIDCNNIK